jgi:hypothetical protein
MVAIETSEVVPLEEVSRCELLVLAAGTSLMEPSGVVRNEVIDANPLKTMLGPWGLTLQSIRCRRLNVSR